ncbi:MAG: DUF2437 domain-containing protein, partial [Quisquiliibacterium sp.]
MRWIRYSTPGNAPAHGLMHGDQIEPVVGDPFGDWTPSGGSLRLSDVTIEVPLMPRTFYAAGLNYTAH